MSEPEVPRAGFFPPTRHSLLGRAAIGDDGGRRAALGELVGLYRAPLMARLRGRHRLDPDRAEDVLQDFLAECLLRRRLVATYAAERGTFRTYLATALDRFVVSAVHRRTGKEQVQFPRTRLESGVEVADGDARGPAEVDEFDAVWALEVAASALGRLRRHCEEAGQGRTWEVFARRLLGPALWDEPEEPYDALAARLGFASAKHAADALTTAKRILRAILPSVVGRFVPAMDDVPEALADLVRILGRCGAERTRGLRILFGTRSAEVAMVEDEGDSIRPPLLAGALDGREAALAPWAPEELGVLWRHLLATPVRFYVPAPRREATPGDHPPLLACLEDLLEATTPDAGLLASIKRFARDQRRDPRSPMPREIAAVLYYLCISLAALRSGREITSLGPDDQVRGLEWAVRQGWIGPHVASILREHLDRLSGDASCETLAQT